MIIMIRRRPWNELGKKKKKFEKQKELEFRKKTRLVSEEKSDRNICVSNKQHDKNNNQNEINKSCEVTANYLCML